MMMAVDDTNYLVEIMMASANHLSVELLANIFEFLGGPKDIMQKRRVCKKWKEAVRMATVPPSEFFVNSVEKYNAMNLMTRAMPNLQQIKISFCRRFCLGYYHKYNDGEDPDERKAADTADWTSRDIEIISNFSKLRILKINSADLNGRYPFLFNSFPLLQKLSIRSCFYLKWDLEMLAGFPLLKELECRVNSRLTGNISSLGVLKDTLVKVKIYDCPLVEGNIMDLADFPHLKTLKLGETAVTGDIRDIGKNDFQSLERLSLPKTIYGGRGYELQRISDAPDLLRTVYLLKKQRPALKMKKWYGKLSEDSPDWYESADDDIDTPPFYIRLVKAGSRIGYRWTTCFQKDSPCEVNWLDSEPDRGSSDYEMYIEKLRKMTHVNFYRGFHQPPTEEDYRRLCDERGAQ